jgi:hypothetical protein
VVEKIPRQCSVPLRRHSVWQQRLLIFTAVIVTDDIQKGYLCMYLCMYQGRGKTSSTAHVFLWSTKSKGLAACRKRKGGDAERGVQGSRHGQSTPHSPTACAHPDNHTSLVRAGKHHKDNSAGEQRGRFRRCLCSSRTWRFGYGKGGDGRRCPRPLSMDPPAWRAGTGVCWLLMLVSTMTPKISFQFAPLHHHDVAA